jgi:hypothetical protein
MAETKTVVIPNNVNGDITSCKIETSEIRVNRDGAFSLTELTTYRSYDVCTKQTINEYQASHITGFGGFCIFIGIIFLIIFGIVAATR